ncbi:multidrug resistance-associated protein 1-like [Mercenaria mercenaria]|uniref:multidrug resistance-associated protein 1-like n=1 Tax=Mercenaria mercenaria TaxID=6596 RepID=UPI00234EBC29|nr:multidrug resistance-associated protein 1-like [Mercenaria mercenaria]
MAANVSKSGDILYSFCGDVPFWDPSTVDVATPIFSPCFLDTVLIWGPCAYLWILSPFFLIYMYKGKRLTPLPFSKLSACKSIVSFLIMCMVVLQLIFQEHDGYACDSNTSISAASYTATALKFITFLLTIVLQQLQRHRGMKTSGVPFVFWLLLIGCETFSLYAHAQRQSTCSEDVAFYIYFILLVIQFVLHCFAEQYPKQGYHEIDDDNLCPDENASVLRRIFFEWLTPVVIKCYKNTFNPAEFWDQTSRLKADNLGPLLENAWKEEIIRCERERKLLCNPETVYQNGSPRSNGYVKRQNGVITEETPLIESGRYSKRDSVNSEVSSIKPSLYRAIFRTYIWVWSEATAYMAWGEMLWLAQPIILRFIIQMIETEGPVEAEWKGYFYAVLLFIVLCINTFMYHISFHHMMTVGLKIKTSLICLIYKKATTMNRSGLKSTTVGEIVNLMSVDCQRIQDAFMFSFYIVCIFIVLLIAVVQLWDLMGVASLGGLAVILLVLPTVGFIATKQYKLQKELLRLKGNRIKILNEVISGIKVLKMYAWEPSFMKRIQAIRKLEIDCLWKYALYAATTIVFAVHSPFMINFVLITIYVLTSPTHSLGAEETFTALSIINILRYPIALCPFLVNGAVQGFVSIGRIQAFLWTEDIKNDNINIVKQADHPVTIESGDFAWNADIETPVLTNINLKVEQGELIAVVGQVGSGKSSLISACLGEMVRLSGKVTLKGKVAYVPQEAWIQNMTLRDNILFGKKYQEKKYRKVLETCALLPDLEILAGGDMTEIGEKGINISGGQKQRVSLARSVYNNADVYFLDDPLSAVDSHVGKHLFQKVIGNEGLLKHKTRILVTHGIHWLPMVDRIVVLNNGIISEVGSYEELIYHQGDFARFLQQYLQQDDDEDDPEIQEIKETIRSQFDEARSDGGMTSEDDGMTASGRIRRRSTKISAYTVSRSMSRHKDSEIFNPEDLSRLTADETSQEGAIKGAVLLTYMKAMGLLTVVIVFVCMSLFQGLNVFSNFWLTYWTEDELLKNVSLYQTQEYEDKYLYYLLMYMGMGIIQGIVVFISFYMALTRMVRASGILHNSMLKSILRSPMSFFDTTPIGRMMNRFSSDVDIMDNKLPESFRLWSIMVFSTLAVVIVVGVTTPIFIAAIIPIGILYAFAVKFYLPTARQMRRTESVRRSPIYNHFSETITGAAVIRAYRCSDRFVQESRKRVDENIKFYYASNTGARWIGIRLEILGNVIAFLATVFGLVSDDLNGAQVGLSITYAVQITITLNLVVLAISEMEMNIVSAERVSEYTTLQSEAGWVLESAKPPIDWPRSGTVEFRNFLTRYREGLDLVLRGINCVIKDGEKVGIVGRTGAGKSSLTLCLFRLIESAGGSILIDGVDISKLGLHDLRTKLTILPQDPVLFSGSLRSNLDPFGRYNDENIWYALECAHLKTFVDGLENGLNYECGEGGQNLSVGQRQLVCLARTLLHKTKVLILDEATAAVDMETDDLIQDTIREQFRDCTILTVAHRLNTIMDYDRVMVLDAGLIKEFDSPQTLLQDTNGVFYGMAKNAGLV